MCGIVGVIGPLADRLGDAWLDEAVASLHHRGPDGRGTWREEGVALGHTRLSIIDLSAAGHQPMHAADDAHVIVYNGEIYNGTTLATPHLQRGWQPRGHSDTEVVQKHLIADGWRGLADLNGMFALAHYDRATGTCVLARDRAGIKPLYYAELDGSVAFASELATLATLPGLDKRVDPVALSAYLALGMVPAPLTILRGVRQLSAGQFATVTPGRPVSPRPFCARVGALIGTVPLDRQAQDAELERLVLQAVSDQLVADVPVGVLLSGGVDSSVIAAAAARCKRDVRTFAVVHDDPAWDESEAARTVARHIGSHHTEIQMPGGGLSEDELHALVAHHGDPFADSSSLPTRRLARIVRQHVTVALSGDGGDELFAGYPRFLQQRWVDAAGAIPSALRRPTFELSATLARHLPGSSRLVPRRVARALSLSQRSAAERAVGTYVWYWPEEQHTALVPELRAPLTTLNDIVAAHSAGGISLATADGSHRMEQHLSLPGDMLTKVDRMTMAESLEIRPPLLDNRIMAFAAALPIDRKLEGRECKAILRSLARRWVPAEVVDRKKQGFGLPLVDYGGAVLADATAWALTSTSSPLQRLMTDTARQSLAVEFERRGEGTDPEDSAYRRAHRQWSITLLGLALDRLGAVV